MNNQREIYEALLKGEVLANNEFSCSLHKDGHLIDDEGDLVYLTFSRFKEWQIYKEPKWYENIPDGGVLCWVKDGEGKAFNKYLEMVINYCDDSTHFFETPNESWMFAEPLTKQEIQVFMDNAPGNV